MIWINYRIWINSVYLFTTHDISSSQSHHNTSSLFCSADSQRQYKPFVLQSPEKSESGRQYKPFVLQQLTQEHNTNRLYCRRLGGSSYHICIINMMRKQSFKCSRSSMIFLQLPSNAVTKCLLLLSVTSFFTWTSLKHIGSPFIWASYLCNNHTQYA